MQSEIADYTAAAASHQLALNLHGGLGNQIGEASALNGIGNVHHETGDTQAAISYHQ